MINKQQIHVYFLSIYTVCHLQNMGYKTQIFTTGEETNYLQLVSTLNYRMPCPLVRPWKYCHTRAVATLLVLSPHYGGRQKVFVSDVYLVPSAGYGRENGGSICH